MQMKIKDVNINYIRYGNIEGKTLVFLHGWGQNIEMMRPVADHYQKQFDLLIVDLPGHGLSEEPKYAWQLKDFVEAIHELLNKLNINNPTFIGHSFGGRLSLLYASMYPIDKLVLFASPFKVEVSKVSMKTKILKTAKKIPVLNKLEGFAKKHIGSTDYKNATPIMREILVNTVNTDLEEDVKKIKCPTIIIWGTNDQEADIKRAYELENLIEDAGLIVYENCTHYAYLENLGQTISIMNSFLK